MLAAGSRDVLVTNMLSEHGTLCLARLAARYPSAAVSTLVDCPAHVANLQASGGGAAAGRIQCILSYLWLCGLWGLRGDEWGERGCEKRDL